jgi:hypothetical protein
MKRVATGAAAAAAAAVGAVVAGQRLARVLAVRSTGRDRWHCVTINRSPAEVETLPEPLAEWGNAIEVRVRPAPGGRGTELAARLREEVPTGLGQVTSKLRDDDPVRQLRRTLREAKQLAEIGEVLLPDSPPTTERTPLNRPLEYATRHGREEGRL